MFRHFKSHFKMSDFIREKVINKCSSTDENGSNIECAVCLQTCVHPAELPCGHIFCYLCIKGIVNQGKRCAMCRQDIPVDYLNKPKLLKPMEAEITDQGFEDGHLWFYEGHNGWWQYDERTTLELESAYQKGERCCDLLIAGFLYVADFDGMIQYQKNAPFRRRRIKRDLATTTKKGIAGLKASMNSNSSEMSSHEVMQNFSVSNSTVPNNLNGIRMFSSGSNNSDQIVDPPLRTQSSHSLSESLSRCSLSTCAQTLSNPTNLNLTPSTGTSIPSINLNLNSVIQDTLDLTIEQIESLNLEVLNDYEAVFREVNNYEELQSNLNQNRYRGTNCTIRYLNLNNPLNDSYQIDLDSNHRVSDLCNLDTNVVNNTSYESSPVTSEEINFSYSEINRTPSNRPLLQSDSTSPPPLPPPRSMDTGRLRSDSLPNSTNSNCETFFEKNYF